MEPIPIISDHYQREEVIIVGGGPSGLATAACLRHHGISSIILERDNCSASLWRRRTYDRLHLHLAKNFCSLPHMPFPSHLPTFVSKSGFIEYLDDYIKSFNLCIRYNTRVESAEFNENSRRWIVTACKNNDEILKFDASFLVVATGENDKPFLPEITGIESYPGEVIHSSSYKSGKGYKGKNVLVVGCGNSGMEIAYDLAEFGAKTSIVIRSPLHVVTKEMIHMGMVLLKHLPIHMADALVLILCKLKFGDLSKYGIHRPKFGPFLMKATTGRSPVIDVGTAQMIKNGKIQVLPEIREVKGSTVTFSGSRAQAFDAIVFATGYKSSTSKWLQDKNGMLKENGTPSKSFPNHWKGNDGVYCAGLSKRGLHGCSMDAQSIADDIKKNY